jgi:hypothetical protein
MRLGQAAACAAITAFQAALGAPARAADVPAGPPAPDAPLPPLSEARPPPPAVANPAPPRWEQHIEVGGGAVFTQTLTSLDSVHQHFRPGAGFHIDLSWPVFRYLRFTAYLLEHGDSMSLAPNAIVPGPYGLYSAHTYAFGVRISPTLHVGERLRLWVTAGGGWGHIAYDYFTQTSPAGAVNPTVVFPGRSETFFDVPFGLGGSIVLIPRWLSAHVELMASVAPSQIGDALDPGQYIGANGMMRTVGPMPSLDVAFIETFGFSIHL